MARVNEEGYIERRTAGKNHQSRKKGGRVIWRDWWLIKHSVKGNKRSYGLFVIGSIALPKNYIGKKIRLKVEIVKENKKWKE